MSFVRIYTRNIVVAVIMGSIVSGCAGSLQERNRLEAERWAKIWKEKPVVVDGEEQMIRRSPSAELASEEELAPVQDRILSDQDDRIKRIETSIEALTEHQADLKNELDSIKENTEKLEVSLDENTGDANMAKQQTGVSNAMGIHLASYRNIENLKTGWDEYLATGQEVILNKQVKVSNAIVSGKEYLRLVVGPYGDADDAASACDAMKKTVSFCDVIDFKGEDLQ